MKKLLSALFAIVMLFVCVSVNADANSITVTRTKTEAEVTYNLYKLFDLDYNAEAEAYHYTVNSAWADFFNGTGKNLITRTDAGYVTGIVGDDNTVINTGDLGNTNSNITNFRNAVLAAAAGKEVDTKTAKTETSVVFNENITYGYYLVDSSLGAFVSINTAKPSATVVEKNTETVPDKVANQVTTGINKVVSYTVNFTIGSGVKTAVFKDTMSKGLTFNAATGITSFKVNGVESTAYTISPSTGSVKADGTNTTFTITLDSSIVAAGNKITITYEATVNEEAVTVNDNKVENKASVIVNNKHEVETTPVTTPLYNLTYRKVDGEDRTLELSGAEFTLWDASTNGNAIPVVFVEDVLDENNNVVEKVYRVAVSGETGVNMVAGKVTIKGLDSGTYYLQEEVEPEGYTKATSRFTVVTNDLLDATSLYNEIPNVMGNVLPSTGGVGTTLFVTVGSLIVLAFGVMLLTKARVAKEFN